VKKTSRTNLSFQALAAACTAATLALGLAGCMSPTEYRAQADKAAAQIIADKQQEALGRTEPFTIERPQDTLRRKLLVSQNLPVTGGESLMAPRS